MNCQPVLAVHQLWPTWIVSNTLNNWIRSEENGWMILRRNNIKLCDSRDVAELRLLCRTQRIFHYGLIPDEFSFTKHHCGK